jgi:hypothetical protein
MTSGVMAQSAHLTAQLYLQVHHLAFIGAVFLVLHTFVLGLQIQHLASLDIGISTYYPWEPPAALSM